jgi:diaminopimelate epimerase
MKFWKMSGSGNDFVFVDARGDAERAARWSEPGFVRAVCALHTGVGADGIAIIQLSATQDFALRYLNRDGSVGELCGNASLCATRLAVELGAGAPSGLSFESGAGVIRGRLRDGQPEIDLQPATELRPEAGIPRHPGEVRMGFVNSGVPHLVIRTDRLEEVPLASRGPELRNHESFAAGANVNWVARSASGGWAMRTYERGVEAETLACGTGAVACAVLLGSWGEAGGEVALETRSGRTLAVRLTPGPAGRQVPSLAGEGRIVFEGALREL